MIKFKDVESYENALLKVSAMSTSEQVSFLNSLSFKSQMILMQEADGELDKICNQAADKAEFDVLYEKYKHKYGDVFMFNTIDATDLSPYSRLVYVANEYFVNMKGEFMIGDSLVVDKVYIQSPNQKIPNRKTKCVIETHLNIKQNVILGANLKPV